MAGERLKIPGHTEVRPSVRIRNTLATDTREV